MAVPVFGLLSLAAIAEEPPQEGDRGDSRGQSSALVKRLSLQNTDREKTLAFVNQLRLLIRNGDLSDKTFLEETMGGTLVLRRRQVPDRERQPNASWEESYWFDLQGVTFPIRPPYGSSTPTAFYVYSNMLTGKVDVKLTFPLQYEDKSTCVTQTDMAEGFGSELPRNDFNVTKPSHNSDSRSYLIITKSKIETTVSAFKDSGCVTTIYIRQES